MPDRSAIRKLKALVSMRERLVKSKDNIAKPLKEYKTLMPASYKMLQQGCKGSLQTITKDIQAVEKQIQALIHGEEKIKQQYTIATSVTGIGPVTACHMILCPY